MTPLNEDPFNVMICGVGGQGNVLVASLIGAALDRKGYFVTVGDTYGAAQRGGAVHSSIRVSGRKTYGPLIPEGKAHLIVGLEPLEALRLLVNYGNSGVVCISNTSTVNPVGVLANGLQYPDVEALRGAVERLSGSSTFLDATGMAASAGSEIAMNMVMAGALVGSGLLPIGRNDVEEEMKTVFPAGKIDLNLKAFDRGFRVTNGGVDTCP